MSITLLKNEELNPADYPQPWETRLSLCTPTGEHIAIVGRAGIPVREVFEQLVWPVLLDAGYSSGEIKHYMEEEWQPTQIEESA